MGKSILILKGSPRAKGNSAVLAEKVMAGAEEAGAKVESIYLHGKNIQPCDACDVCQDGYEGCIIEDDMQAIYPKVESAEVIVIASPVYWFTISAQTKLCIDRWYAFGGDDYRALRGKKLGLVLVFGDTDLYTSGGINAIHTFESMARYLDMEIAGMVYGMAWQQGEAAENPELLKRAYELGVKLAE